MKRKSIIYCRSLQIFDYYKIKKMKKEIVKVEFNDEIYYKIKIVSSIETEYIVFIFEKVSEETTNKFLLNDDVEELKENILKDEKRYEKGELLYKKIK